ncbi:hypothetical protein OAC41_06100 [Acidimicrobiales bacterium]|jgi:hypothetical protein|nr:hypothetical protein [Acidimicrobiaceae bacterium]MDA8848271.1 hypothetical protein [bacterium]MDB4110033.1 hypothetical protein [bacterium]MDB9846319.1 hypothetical protein [Acidimicrobiales bacterium]MDC0350025.1 hypothetical protein [bacterium]
MKVFQRVMTLKPECLSDGLTAVVDTIEYMNANSGQTWFGWQVLAGMPVGTVAVSTRADSWAALAETQAAMRADSGYMDRGDKVLETLSSAPQDWVMNPIAGVGNMPEAPEIIVQTINRAPFHKVAEAIELNQQFCQMITDIAGTPSVAMMTTLGEINPSFALLLYYNSLAEYEERNTPEVWSMIGNSPLQEQGRSVFEEGSAVQAVSRRIA